MPPGAGTSVPTLSSPASSVTETSTTPPPFSLSSHHPAATGGCLRSYASSRSRNVVSDLADTRNARTQGQFQHNCAYAVSYRREPCYAVASVDHLSRTGNSSPPSSLHRYPTPHALAARPRTDQARALRDEYLGESRCPVSFLRRKRLISAIFRSRIDEQQVVRGSRSTSSGEISSLDGRSILHMWPTPLSECAYPFTIVTGWDNARCA
ncbi:hypothetical protein OE88DRAFT_756706 [Heliocybe sulcata]|uniref:Uncharacterized protein n=1 Tax=Heliocybe sulcata TaxID=5364 RepID=A0A5C3MTT9_9AGAM|nr:hypothetical protein OE88DRAFT_756706 [Heliocybe sulcata]